MKKSILTLTFSAFLLTKSFSQCEVKSFQIEGTKYRYSMSEKFYRNEDLENGVKSVYLHTNTFKDI